MPGSTSREALRGIDELFRLGTLAGLSDGQLLGRFVAGPGDVAASAFAALVERHGPMVLRACRRELGDAHDAEDAAQRAFLALARGARTIRRRESAAGWLLAVALRISRRDRRDARRRRRLERGAARPEGLRDEPDRPDLAPILLEELGRLAGRHRDPIVLHHLEGLTVEQAAARLGLPLRTAERRLSEGRERLRARLVRRGVALSAAALAIEAGASTLPDGWALAVARRALAAARGETAALIRPGLKLAAAALLAGLGPWLLLPSARGQKPPAPAPAAAPQPARGPGRVLRLQVVADDTGRPIPGASVRINFPYTHRDERLTADAQGRVDFRHSTGLDDDWMHITVDVEGYTLRVFRWGSDNNPIPDVATIRLRPGVLIGGVVVDERGRPVPGAVVHVSVYQRNDESDEYGRLAEGDVTARTGPDGRWQTRSVPEFSGVDRIEVVHPDHEGDRDFGKIPQGAFRSGTATLVVPTTPPLEGQVLDADDRPVAGASLVPARTGTLSPEDNGRPWLIYDTRGSYSGKSGPDGRFRLPRSLAYSETLVAMAPGHAVALADIRGDRAAKPIEVRLPRLRPFRGRVVDTAGRPIAGVRVRHAPVRAFGLLLPSLWTDADGRFRIDDMADGPFLLSLSEKPGYLSRFEETANPSDDEVRYVLRRSLVIKGRFHDASTGRVFGGGLEEEASIEIGLVDPGTGSIRWREGQKRFGGIEEVLDAEVPGLYRFRITAAGYKPFVSRDFKGDEGRVTYDVTLTPEKPKADPEARTIAGTVVGPDGKPAAGATVSLSGGFLDGPSLVDGRLVPSRDDVFGQPTLSTTTGPDGRFSIRASAETPDEPERALRSATLLAVHDRFFGRLDLEEFQKTATLKVEPWGRVEGVFRLGGRPIAGVPVGYVFTRDRLLGSTILGRGSATTDAQGRFTFDRVAPGGVRIEQRTGSVHDPRSSVRGVFAFVKPGETAKVDLGDAGRSVVGQVAPPEGIDLGSDPAAVVDVSVASDGPDPAEEREALKTKVEELEGEEKHKAYERLHVLMARTTLDGTDTERPRTWWEALHGPDDAGRRWVKVGRAAIDRALRFRVDDLPPGPYRIKVVVRAGVGAEWSGTFTVPGPSPGGGDPPIDLGTLRPEPKPPPPTGEGREPGIGAG